MASSSDGDAFEKPGHAHGLSSAQEQLLRTQLQQLGLEAGDDAPGPYKDRTAELHAAPPPPPPHAQPAHVAAPVSHAWPSTAWGHDTLDMFGAARAAAANPWSSPGGAVAAAPPPSTSTKTSLPAFPQRNPPELSPSFRFPSSRPTYVPSSEEVEQQRHAIQLQIEQLQRQQEQLQWHQHMLQPQAASQTTTGLSPDGSHMRSHSLRPVHLENGYRPTSMSGSWISPSMSTHDTPTLHHNFTFPPRAQNDTAAQMQPMPPQRPASTQPGASPSSRKSSNLSGRGAQQGHARHASQQLASELSPKFLMAGGGLINLNTLGLSGAWGELEELNTTTSPRPPSHDRMSQRHSRSSSASSAAPSTRSAEHHMLTSLPQAQAQLAALRRSRQHFGPSSHGRSMSHGRSASMGSNGGNGGASRRALFGSYLPQNSLPLLLLAGKLVVGILRVNKRNRSDAWVTTEVLGHDIFINGSKDRNRALEGDLVAVELLNPKEVWQTKRDKVDKKKRKEESQQHGTHGTLSNASSLQGVSRRTDKARDDIEVEGAQLKLIEDEEESENSPPLLAGHVVAIVERMPGQIFSGTLALLRPSSAATKEKQQAGRAEGESPVLGTPGAPRPKIIWFRPSDKRVPLIAIPSDQAPEDFWSEEHQDSYSRCLFVACIKRWPITSLHPFGALVDRIGPIGELHAESQALLRSHCHDIAAPFLDVVLRSVPNVDTWSIPEREATRRRVFTGFTIAGRGPRQVAFSIDQPTTDTLVLGVHAADITYFLTPNSALDREARRRGASVHLVEESYEMLPPNLLQLAALDPSRASLTKSVVFTLTSGRVVDVWMGYSITNTTQCMNEDDMRNVLEGKSAIVSAEALQNALQFTEHVRSERVARGALLLPHTWLEFELDAERRPTGLHTQTDVDSLSHKFATELCIRANTAVAQRTALAFNDTAVLERQEAPMGHVWDDLVAKLQTLGMHNENLTPRSLASSLLTLPAKARLVADALVSRALTAPKLYTPAVVDVAKFWNYAIGEPIYTHFCAPLQRYSDVCVHRQLDTVFDGTAGGDELQSIDTLSKLTHQSNIKNRAAQVAEAQSMHLYLCYCLKDEAKSREGLQPRKALVMSVSAASMDVLVPSLTVERRVHLDCLPLEHIEWHELSHTLTLTWRAGADSLAWLGQTIDDAQCAALAATTDTAVQKSPPSATAKAPVAHTQQQCITPMTEVDVFVLSDMDKSPPILKVVLMNPCA